MKQEILQYIKTLAEQKIVTKYEIDLAYDSGNKDVISKDIILVKKNGVAEILYYIGGIVVFLGIAILIAQNWSTLGFGTKVLVTLGSGIVSYFIGTLFSRAEQTENIGSAFYLISALTMPMGLYVVFDNAGFDASS